MWGNSLFTLAPLPANYLKTPLELTEKIKTDGVETEVPVCSIIISGPDAFNFEADVQGMQRVYRQSGGEEYEMVWRKGKSNQIR